MTTGTVEFEDNSEQGNMHQYLSFILAGEEYAADILKVQEIRDWTSSTLIPNSPPYIEGVLNLRGDIIPIINLRTRFCLAPSEQLLNRIVIVLNIETNGRQRLMGLLVDAVADTYNVNMDNVKPAPPSSSVIDNEFIVGLTTLEKKLVILLDVDQLLSSDELAVA
ncbi:MAG: purine-binding chemotaxis protein CheW [Gammaproteobacteria bacterium]|nr:purine-binding chemotaxis protein CheW [Gammaproteobacteria bacterium]